MKISALILTLDEEQNLSRCLESLYWCDDIVVLDSFSQDQTAQIAERFKVRFVQRVFDDYARQRNFGLKEVSYKYEWLLMVDADEVVSEELKIEIQKLPENDKDICIYRMRRKDHFMGKWIKRSSGYPTWFGRLHRLGHTTVERAINEEYHTDGAISFLTEHLLHYPFNKGFQSWLDKHNRYSTMEASNLGTVDETDMEYGFRQMIDPVIRRKTLKSIIYKMPARPFLVFFLLYFFRLGFLDGRAGLTFCILRSFYEYMIDCKVCENKLRIKNLPL